MDRMPSSLEVDRVRISLTNFRMMPTDFFRNGDFAQALI
jgi:hypothetical protein